MPLGVLVPEQGKECYEGTVLDVWAAWPVLSFTLRRLSR